MEIEELGRHQHRVGAGDEGLPVRGQDDAHHAAGTHGGHHCGRESHHPHQIRVGIGGQPVQGQEHVQQAGAQCHHPPQGYGGVRGRSFRGQGHVQQAAEVHGCSHHGKVNR